jgi:hypothetical protein
MRIRSSCSVALFVLLGNSGLLCAAAPPVRLDSAHVKVLLRKLDADSFHTRQKADESLRALGKAVLPLLREELTCTTSLEVRFRLNRMVHDLTLDERIPGLVQMLGNTDAQNCAQAEHALRQAGAVVVPLLKKELTPTLEGEQRKRLERIIAELSATRR